jgi:hypothetical protein
MLADLHLLHLLTQGGTIPHTVLSGDARLLGALRDEGQEGRGMEGRVSDELGEGRRARRATRVAMGELALTLLTIAAQ